MGGWGRIKRCLVNGGREGNRTGTLIEPWKGMKPENTSAKKQRVEEGGWGESNEKERWYKHAGAVGAYGG